MNHPFSRYLPAFVLIGAAAATIGCTDLTEAPRGEITEANFNPTADDLVALLAPVYTPQREIWMSWYGMVDFQSETADDLISPVRPLGWYDGGIYIRLHEHRWDATQPQPNSLWGRAYNGINAANRVIHQIESELIPLDDASAASTLAELRAVRAYYYSLLLDNFGNVPIVTDFTTEELPVQHTRQQVYDFVTGELAETIPHLSEATDGSTYGRMNRWAALGILARVQLNADVYTGTARWDEVLALTEQIIGSGRFELEETYRAAFSRNNNTSREIIFTVPYHSVFGTGSNFHMKTLKADLRFVFNLNATPWGGISAAPQFIDSYDPDDGRLHDTWLMGDYFDAQDRGYTFVKHVRSIEDSECYCAGFPVGKYEIYSGMTGASDVDYPALRYADVLLMRAEALLRTGDADGAAELVTQVRQRNFSGEAAPKAAVTGADLLQGSRYDYGWYDVDGQVKSGAGGPPVHDGGADILYGRFLDELGWELVAEGHRRQQLIRFGVFTTKMWFNHTPNGDHRIVFAIPQARLDTNPNLEQNPGY